MTEETIECLSVAYNNLLVVLLDIEQDIKITKAAYNTIYDSIDDTNSEVLSPRLRELTARQVSLQSERNVVRDAIRSFIPLIDKYKANK